MDYRESWQLTPATYRTHAREDLGYVSKALLFVQTNVAGLVLAGMFLLSFIGLHPIAIFGEDTSTVGLQVGDGDGAKQAVFVLLFLLTAADTVAHRGAKKLLAVPLPFVVLLAWCWISLLWAIEPGVAIRRVILTTLTILSISYCVERLGYAKTLRVLVATFAFILVVDWLAIFAFKFAIQQASEVESDLAGDWRGMHSHKNEAGAFCAMSALLFMHVTYKARSLLVGPAFTIASLVFLYMSQSKTSGGFVLVGVLCGAGAVLGYRNPALRNWIGFAALTLIAGVLGLVDIPFDKLLVVFDDPAAFTGRSQIWPVLLSYAQDHLLLGSGYGSFWSVGDTSPILVYGAGWLKGVFEAHNAYLDMLVQTGLIGLVLTIGLLVIRPLYQLFFLPLMPPASRWLICAILTFGCFHDLLETSIMDRANSTWVTMLVMYCLLASSSFHPGGARPASSR